MNRKIFFLMALAPTFLSLNCATWDPDSDDEFSTAEEALTDTWTRNSLGSNPFTSDGSLPLPVCRVPYDGGKHPGKFWDGSCRFEWGGQAKQSFDNYEILQKPASGSYSWKPLCNWDAGYQRCFTDVPGNAIYGGDSGDVSGHQPLYICAAKRNYTEWHVGKYWRGKCNFEYGGEAVIGSVGGYDVHIAVALP